MKTYIVAALAIVTAILLLVTFTKPAPERTYADLQREQIAIEQAQTLAPIWTTAQAIIIIGVPVLILGLAAAWGYVALARFRNERKADTFGRLPVLLSDATVYQSAAVGALADYHATERTRASIQPVPITYSPHVTHNPTSNPTYAPRLSSSYESNRSAIEPVEQPLLVDSGGVIPTVAQLLDQHQIGRGMPLLLGYDADEGTAIPGSWLDLFSVGIGGLSGSGKTWTGVFLIAQAMLHGAKVAVLDPHAGDEDSFTQRAAPLAGRYICPPAQERKTMLGTVKLFTEEIERRKNKGRGEPWILIADEFSALMRGDLAEPLSLLMEAIAQEGRKLGIYGLALGQAWQVDRAGGGTMRDSLASCYIHRLRPAQARYLSGLTASSLPDDVMELQPGRAYLLSTRGELRRVAIPQMVEGDVQRVAGLLTADAPTMERLQSAEKGADYMPESSQKVADIIRLPSAVESQTTANAEATRAAALFLDGKSITEIVKELRGVSSNQGARYQAALAEVQALMREALTRQTALGK